VTVVENITKDTLIEVWNKCNEQERRIFFKLFCRFYKDKIIKELEIIEKENKGNDRTGR
jgi:hypothetical protein